MLSKLQYRASYPAKQLGEPAPNDEQIAQILQCGLSAPDHAALRPWRFITIRGDAREALGEVFVKAALEIDPNTREQKLNLIKEKPLRSPLVVVIVATITPDHPKTPEVEQILSAGAATSQIQLAATELGFGSVWVTGQNAYSNFVKRALGIAVADHIVGFVYMGTPSVDLPVRKRPELSAHHSEWTAPVNG